MNAAGDLARHEEVKQLVSAQGDVGSWLTVKISVTVIAMRGPVKLYSIW